MTLGCSKNTVDSEVLAGQLEAHQYQVIDSAEAADVLIINTCGFVQDAKEESIQAIFEALKLKEQDPAKKVFAAGCLSQRYRAEIEKEIPEVDAIFGTEEYTEILNTLGEQHAALDNMYRMRKISTPRHYAYLKISEGCNHNCAFCAIPGIRGRHRSRTIESLTGEAQKLAEFGAKELILISQDTSYYGRELYNESKIAELADHLQKIDGFEWIRLLYWYPTNFPVEILDLMQPGSKIVPYIDMPIQHISSRMLRLMRRGDTRDSLKRMFYTIREKVPDVTLRTTIILGHPGETNADFKELFDFIKDIKFDRLGTFIYSDEENTAAFSLAEKVNRETALERQKELMELQQNISLQKNTERIGKKYKVLIDEFNPDTVVFSARTKMDAPEIDNEVIVQGKNILYKSGDFAEVEIVDASEYELYAQFV